MRSVNSFFKDQRLHQVVRCNNQLVEFFFNHQVGTSWNKENSINFCVPFVPCLGFLVDCKIPKFKTVSWFNCTQYLVEHDVHIGPCWVPPFASPVWQLHKRELLFLLSHRGGAISRDTWSWDGSSRGNLEQGIRTQVFQSSFNTFYNKRMSLSPWSLTVSSVSLSLWEAWWLRSRTLVPDELKSQPSYLLASWLRQVTQFLNALKLSF